jgi:hypothetical protein
MNKKVVVVNCEDCQYYEVYLVNKKVVEQTCHLLGCAIHRNINMDFPENCPLEDNI